MTIYLSNRDGNGKTSEEGHYKFQTAVFTGAVLGATALLVKQNSPVGMSVLVSAGQYKIDTSSEYSYTGWNTADAAVIISTADPANPRISSIVAYVDKGAVTSASPPNNPGITKFMSVNGTPAASPAAPSGATIQSAVGAGNPYIILANVTTPTAATTIVTANISDQRTRVTIGTDLVNSAAIFDNAITTSKINNLAVTTGKLADNSISTAKIIDAAVTDSKWRNGVAFSARRVGAKTFAGSTWTKISADTIDWNYGNCYSNTADIGRFTATVAGPYLVTINLFTEAAVQARAIVSIWKNGSEFTRIYDSQGSAQANAGGASTLWLNVGDYIEYWGWINAGGNIAHASRTVVSTTLITRAP